MRFLSIVFSISIFVFLTGCQTGGSNSNPESEQENAPVDSLQVLTRMIKEDSLNFKYYADRARIYVQKGEVDPALRDLNKAIELKPDDAGLFVLLGDVYFIIGKKEGSLTSYKKALRMEPENMAPVVKLAETYLILKDYEEAAKYIDLMISKDVNNKKAYYLKGIQLMETGDTAQALINLKIAGNLDSTYYEAFMQTGSLYTAKKDSLAIDFYKAALKARPDDERALLLLALSYQYNNNFDKALDTYQQIERLNPSNKTAFFNSGYIYMVEKQNFDSAVVAFQHAIDIDPSYVEAVYNLGRIYEEQGDYRAAKTQYKQALELETNYPLAVEGLNRLDRYSN